MIVFKPAANIRKRFSNIDFESLSLAYSAIHDSIDKREKKRTYTITINDVKSEYSSYPFIPGHNVMINISYNIDTEALFMRALTHEFRHFLQNKVFKLTITKKTYDESTTQTYHDSPLEVDACDFEYAVLYKVTRLYQRITKFKKELGNVIAYKG